MPLNFQNIVPQQKFTVMRCLKPACMRPGMVLLCVVGVLSNFTMVKRSGYTFWFSSDDNSLVTSIDNDGDCSSTTAYGRDCWSHKSPIPGQDNELCVPMRPWQTLSHPNGNTIHEIDIPNGLMDESIRVFGKGGTSIGWKVGHIILKTIRIDKCIIDFDEKNAEKIRIDAMAMEHRTSSPRIINIYGLGGFSQLLEFAEGGRLRRDIVKKLSSEKKLEYAIAIAQSVSDLHGPENATLVHGDMDSSQFLLMADGTLKLNDFNQGFFLRHNKARKTPCGFQKEEYFNTGKRWTKPEMNTPCSKNNFARFRKTGRKIDARALEELMGMPLSEKIDIYGIGAMFYYLLTNSRPYECQPTQVCSTDFMGRPQKTISTRKIMELKRANILPSLPTEISNSTIPEIISIQHAMTLAFQRDPEKRPSAQFIANLLKETRDSLREKKKETQKRSDKKENESEKKHEVNYIDRPDSKNIRQLSKKSNQNKTSGTRNMHLNLPKKSTGHIFFVN